MIEDITSRNHTCWSGGVVGELVGHLGADQPDTFLNVSLVWVTGFNVTLWNPVRTVEGVRTTRTHRESDKDQLEYAEMQSRYLKNHLIQVVG